MVNIFSTSLLQYSYVFFLKTIINISLLFLVLDLTKLRAVLAPVSCLLWVLPQGHYCPLYSGFSSTLPPKASTLYYILHPCLGYNCHKKQEQEVPRQQSPVFVTLDTVNIRTIATCKYILISLNWIFSGSVYKFLSLYVFMFVPWPRSQGSTMTLRHPFCHGHDPKDLPWTSGTLLACCSSCSCCWKSSGDTRQTQAATCRI